MITICDVKQILSNRDSCRIVQLTSALWRVIQITIIERDTLARTVSVFTIISTIRYGLCVNY